jgi:hypothetical protein
MTGYYIPLKEITNQFPGFRVKLAHRVSRIDRSGEKEHFLQLMVLTLLDADHSQCALRRQAGDLPKQQVSCKLTSASRRP